MMGKNNRQRKRTTKVPRTTRRDSSPEQKTSKLHAQLQQLELTLATLEADPDLQADEKATLGRCYQERRELLRLQLELLPQAERAALFAQSILQFEASEGGKLKALRRVQSLGRARAFGSGGNPNPARDSAWMREGTIEEQAERLQRERSKKARDDFEQRRQR
jgi:Ser/Thr protein kinase RdoA (MazF antagonist)